MTVLTAKKRVKIDARLVKKYGEKVKKELLEIRGNIRRSTNERFIEVNRNLMEMSNLIGEDYNKSPEEFQNRDDMKKLAEVFESGLTNIHTAMEELGKIVEKNRGKLEPIFIKTLLELRFNQYQAETRAKELFHSIYNDFETKFLHKLDLYKKYWKHIKDKGRLPTGWFNPLKKFNKEKVEHLYEFVQTYERWFKEILLA